MKTLSQFAFLIIQKYLMLASITACNFLMGFLHFKEQPQILLKQCYLSKYHIMTWMERQKYKIYADK